MQPAGQPFALSGPGGLWYNSHWLSLGGETEVRSAALVIGVLIALLAGSALWAGPFSEVPAGHWSYQACSRLLEMEVLSPPGESTAFSGDPQLTRFEFGLSLLAPLSALEKEAALLPPGAGAGLKVQAATRALGLTPELSESEISAAAADLRSLLREFADVLGPMGFEPAAAEALLEPLLDEKAVRAWRAEALSGSDALPGAPALTAPAASLRVPFAKGMVALSYEGDTNSPRMMDFMALSSEEGRGGAEPPVLGAQPARRDPRVSRVRTAYEYDLTAALSLSLAYEKIARRGDNLSTLDTASFASLGVGYRLTPSTSVKLSYSLLEYSNYVTDTPPVRDHVAQTAVTIEF